jgi:hypothetical protein
MKERYTKSEEEDGDDASHCVKANNRRNLYLKRGNTGRQNQTLVVSVHHGEHTKRSGRETPRVLPSVELVSGLVGILELNAEHLGEVLSQAVRRRSLRTIRQT